MRLWRSEARAAGRVLGRTVHTVVTDRYVSAYLLDWPSPGDPAQDRSRG